MFKFEDFTKAFDPKAFDVATVMASVETAQKQAFEAAEKNMKIVADLAEQNVATFRTAVDTMNSQTAKAFTASKK